MNIAIFWVATMVAGVNIAIFGVATVVVGVNIAIFEGDSVVKVISSQRMCLIYASFGELQRYLKPPLAAFAPLRVALIIRRFD